MCWCNSVDRWQSGHRLAGGLRNYCFRDGRLSGRSSANQVVDVHTDEVYFRDTAHGFLAWGISLLVSVALIASAGAIRAAPPDRPEPQPLPVRTPISWTHRFVRAVFCSGAGSAPCTTLCEPEARRDPRQWSGNKVFQLRTKPIWRKWSPQKLECRKPTPRPEYPWSLPRLSRRRTPHVNQQLISPTGRSLVGAFCSSFSATVGGVQRDHVRV